MNVIFYANKSDKRTVNKNIIQIAKMDCNLKDDTSLLTPYLTVANVQLSVYSSCNYVYIPDFNRYYYARLSKGIGGITIIECDVDALMSWRSELLSCRGFVVRQENKYNRFFNDTKMPIRNNKTYTYLEIGRLPQTVTHFLTVDGGVN